MRAVGLEFRKIRRRKVFLTAFLFLLAQAAWCFATTKMMESRGNPLLWERMFYDFSTLGTLFLPMMIAIVVSRICDLEHKGGALRKILTRMPAWRVYGAKFICSFCVLAFFALLQGALMLAFGYYFGMPQPADLQTIFLDCLGMLIASLPILMLQLWVSLTVENQLFSLILGLVGSFLGFMMLLFPNSISDFVPWTYFAKLSTVTPVIEDARMVSYLVHPLPGKYLVISLVLSAVLYLAGSVRFSKQEY